MNSLTHQNSRNERINQEKKDVKTGYAVEKPRAFNMQTKENPSPIYALCPLLCQLLKGR